MMASNASTGIQTALPMRTVSMRRWYIHCRSVFSLITPPKYSAAWGIRNNLRCFLCLPTPLSIVICPPFALDNLARILIPFAVMGNKKTHDHDKAVTRRTRREEVIPVLILAKDAKDAIETVGSAKVQDGTWRVKRFRFDDPKHKILDPQRSKQFASIAKLLALSSGQRVDFSLVREGFRTLTAEAFPTAMADEISAQATRNPKLWCERWLPSIFNNAIQQVRVVMWMPDKGVPGPAMCCPDTETALYVSLLFSRLFSGLRACLGCGVLFVPSRPDKLYHDSKCADKHRHKRFRSEKPKEIQTPKKGKQA